MGDFQDPNGPIFTMAAFNRAAMAWRLFLQYGGQPNELSWVVACQKLQKAQSPRWQFHWAAAAAQLFSFQINFEPEKRRVPDAGKAIP
jgi:hypothetical protein